MDPELRAVSLGKCLSFDRPIAVAILEKYLELILVPFFLLYRNNSEALVRLHELGYRLNSRDVDAIALQLLWCAVRPGACDLNA